MAEFPTLVKQNHRYDERAWRAFRKTFPTNGDVTGKSVFLAGRRSQREDNGRDLESIRDAAALLRKRSLIEG